MVRFYCILIATVSSLYKNDKGREWALALITVCEVAVAFSIYSIIDPESVKAIIASRWFRFEGYGAALAVGATNYAFVRLDRAHELLAINEIDYDYLSIFFIPVVIIVFFGLRAIS